MGVFSHIVLVRDPSARQSRIKVDTGSSVSSSWVLDEDEDVDEDVEGVYMGYFTLFWRAVY